MEETHQTPQTPPVTPSSGSPLHQLEMWLDDILGHKAPAIPANGREAIVKIAPWITLVLLIIALPFVLALFGASAILSPFAFLGGVHAGFSYLITWGLVLVTFVIQIIALPGMFKRKRKSWQLLFYSSLITGLMNILSINIGGLIGTIIGLYLLFQIRSYYK